MRPSDHSVLAVGVAAVRICSSAVRLCPGEWLPPSHLTVGGCRLCSDDWQGVDTGNAAAPHQQAELEYRKAWL